MYFLKQYKINKRIEREANALEEKRAIELINQYGMLLTFQGHLTAKGGNTPPKTSRPSDKRYATDLLIMKDFLDTKTEYKTNNANKIRKYYRLD